MNPDEAQEILRQLAERIIKAGEKGKGIRLTSTETYLLSVYNLPNTADDPRPDILEMPKY